MAKEKMMELYVRKCKAKKANSSDDYRTYAYKPGIAEDASKRDTKGEFLRILNANPKLSLMGAAQDGGSTFDAQVTTDVVLSGPESFLIAPLEHFIFNDYFKGDERTFGTKKEFVSSYEETHKKYEELVTVLSSRESDISDLNEGYAQLDDLKQDKILVNLKGQYSKLLEEIKKKLNEFLTPLSKSTAIKSPPIVATVVANPNQTKIPPATANVGNIDVYNVLLQHFILLKGQGKYMLMHKIHHKGRDPLDSKGSWKVDINLGKKPKFQFHNTDLQKTYGYNQSCLSAAKVIKAFGTNILDYDDPNFNRSLLP